VESAQGPRDKFETLCHVKADISVAPYKSHVGALGKMGYQRDYEIVLLVGLTELKAQISYIDSTTVRAHVVLCVSVYLTRLPYAPIEGAEKRFVVPFSEFLFPD